MSWESRIWERSQISLTSHVTQATLCGSAPMTGGGPTEGTTLNTRRIAASLAAVIAVGGLAACGGGDSGEDGEDVTLRVNLFGKFGYTDLVQEVRGGPPGRQDRRDRRGRPRQVQHQAHPADRGRRAAPATSSRSRRARSSSSCQARQVREPAGLGRQRLKDHWLPWKWDQATTADGDSRSASAPTSAAWRCATARDLFEKAGLPTDREEVGKLWPTWDDFIATGKKFQSGIKDDKVDFVDSATNTYNSILMQQGDHTYFDQRRRTRVRHQPGRADRLGLRRSR